MSAPVAELFASLGFKVDQSSLGKADSGIGMLTTLAERAVAAVESLTAAFTQMGLAAAGAAAEARAASMPAAALPTVAPHGGAHAPAEHGEHGGGVHGSPHSVKHGGGHSGHGAGGLTGWLESATHVTHGFLALFAGHEVLHFAHEMTEAGVAVELTSKKLGITTEAVQQLQFAVGMSNIGTEELNTGLKFLQLNATRAAAGMKEPAAAFRALGVTTKNADGSIRPVDQLLEDVADKIKDLDDPAKQTTMAVQLFGRAGQQLVPFLQQGSEGIRELREEAEELGGGLTETLIENAENYEHALKKFKFAFLGVKSAIGNFLLPILTKLSQAFTFLVGKFNYVAQHTKYLQALLGVGLFAVVVKLVTWFTALGQAAIMSWLKSVGGFILLAAAIAGVTLVLEDLYRGLTGGKSAIGKWIDQWQGVGAFSELVKNIAAGIDAITAALNRLWASPGKAALDMLKGVTAENSVLGQWMIKNGVAHRGEFRDETDRDAAANERANRSVATGRGLSADARGNVDIPRATGRGLLAGADGAFGQAKASVLSAQSANSDSVAPVINIHAHTDASAKEIGHHVSKALDEHQAKVNRNLHRALVPEPEAEETE